MIKRQTVQVLSQVSEPIAPARHSENLVPFSQPSILEEKVGRIQYGIGRGVSIQGGAMRFERSARIDGNFASSNGGLFSTRVLLISNVSKIKSSVEAETALIQGCVEGPIKGQVKVELFSSARVEGDVEAPTVVIHDGAIINGHVRANKMFTV